AWRVGVTEVGGVWHVRLGGVAAVAEEEAGRVAGRVGEVAGPREDARRERGGRARLRDEVPAVQGDGARLGVVVGAEPVGAGRDEERQVAAGELVLARRRVGGGDLGLLELAAEPPMDRLGGAGPAGPVLLPPR